MYEQYSRPNSRDPFTIYLRKIGKYKLLTAEEEYELWSQMIPYKEILEMEKQEDFLEKYSKLTLLEKQEHKRLKQRGIEAKSKLISHNIKLVVSMAKKFINRGLEIQDLVQEGILGLNRAAMGFDATKGWRFSTYSCWWIRRVIQTALYAKGRAVKMSEKQANSLAKLKKQIQAYLIKYNKLPSPRELSEETGTSLQQVYTLFLLDREAESVDALIPYDDNSEHCQNEALIPRVLTVIEDKEERAFYTENGISLAELMSCLTPEEQYIICCLYGLKGFNSGVGKNMVEVSKELGLKPNNLKTLRLGALAKIKEYGERQTRVELS